jgi:hypothetical protein
VNEKQHSFLQKKKKKKRETTDGGSRLDEKRRPTPEVHACSTRQKPSDEY